MDIKFIEDHNRLGLRVIQIPLDCLSGWGFFRCQRRIACFGKIHPHALHGMVEGIIIGPSGEERVLRIIEYGGQLCGMAGKEVRYGGFDPEKVMVCPAARSETVFGYTERRADEVQLIAELEGLMVLIPRGVVQESLCLFHVFRGHFRKLSFPAHDEVVGEARRRHEAGELAHFVLVAALNEIDVFGFSLEICVIGIQRNELAIPFRPILQRKDRPGRNRKFLRRAGEEIGERFAAQRFHQHIGGGDCLFRGACIVRRSALGDDAADIAPADSPKIVTLSGSPPKAAIFSWTHFRPIIWSRIPRF